MKPVTLTLVYYVYYDVYINELVISIIRPDIILRWAGDYPIVHIGVL